MLFHSPYEAAAWAIISARRPAQQAARSRLAISQELGASFELAGQTLHAFPQPDRLIGLADDVAGLTPAKVDRLKGVAQAAIAGALDVGHLRELGPEQSHEQLQRLKGLGPFYASLVVLRASGFTDALLPVPEPKVLAHAARLYGLPGPPTLEKFSAMAEPWRPFRTWTTVLIRLAGDRSQAAGQSGHQMVDSPAPRSGRIRMIGPAAVMEVLVHGEHKSPSSPTPRRLCGPLGIQPR